MSYTFRLIFSGLCVFRIERSDPNSKVKSAAVLLPQLRTPRPLSGKNRIFEPHYPLLKYDPADLIGGTRRADLILPRSRDYNERHICVLSGETIKIRRPGKKPQESQLTLKEGIPKDKSRPTKPGERRLFWWVAKMNSVIDGKLPNIKKKTKFAAEVSLQEGILRTHKLSRQNDKLDIWSFQRPPYKPNSKAPLQAIASEVACDIRVSKPIELALSANKVERTLIFEPPTSPADPGEPVVEVRISNLELEDLIPDNARENEEPRYDDDFEVFYDLLAGGRPSKPPIPVLALDELEDGHPSKPGGIGGGAGKFRRPCASVAFTY